MGSHLPIAGIAGCALGLMTFVGPVTAQSSSPYSMPTTAPGADSSAGWRGPQVVPAPGGFNQPEENDTPNLPPPPGNPLQQMVKEPKNWTEMTPDEILGVKNFKDGFNAKSDTGKAGADAKPMVETSPLQEFLMQQRLAQTGSTNLNGPADSDSFRDQDAWGGTRHQSETMPLNSSPGMQIFNHLLQNVRGESAFAGGEAEWAGVFMTPPPVQPTLAQRAEMDAFRQLLQPAPAPDNKSDSSLPVVAVEDPNLERPNRNYNPNGATFAPLDSGINRPRGIAPLPGVTGSSAYKTPYVRPAWAPQPPPWTLNTPQLFVEPMRKF